MFVSKPIIIDNRDPKVLNYKDILKICLEVFRSPYCKSCEFFESQDGRRIQKTKLM